ncbi:oligopeptide/dipeptide ABC transporter, ATPase subunit [Ignisphaera aggregans DSM 17230]|uniref:Oligopeptide/dipeptide ABC transporter, ATPase subunit n=1 Tax=Ignisphaera aggregans (strain DSM 17230 / JCM 13409 / AQ1.S1) TaxID=583356 RepID=E0SNH7_IGNAA|nr:oligopeptide/dipeptide ABC transporter, ATPase subunit [Ignisphaera aggregans DSM 17230]
MDTMLQVEQLKLYYITLKGVVRAVDGVSFEIDRGESIAIVGESGSGKSSLARAILKLLPRNVFLYDGKVILDGEDISKLNEAELNSRVRWSKISFVPQAAMNSLNPVIKIGDQLIEPLIYHKGYSKDEAIKKAIEMITYVGIPNEFINRYPFELSGGMRQRVIIAMALITEPKIVILDEPTSALDVITQANIMNLLKRVRLEKGISYIFITHDIALASDLADKVGVMYAGKIVELSDADTFYTKPLHPYSQLLLSSVPSLREDKNITYIKGTPPSLINPPPGCRFHPRCPFAMDICRREEPPLISIEKGVYVRCWLYGGK